MKLTFILPAIGKKPGEKYIGTWKMEPLTVAVLKSLTPAWVETEFFDDRVECIDYETQTDLVVITLETYTALRGYAIARRFRDRGIPVVFGGYHATLLPEEAACHGDAVVIGNGETVWETLLTDFAQGRLQPLYRGAARYGEALPDRSIFAGKPYVPVALVETGRGCCHRCEFCAISAYYCARYVPRSPELVGRDLERQPHRYAFLVDDNLVADPAHTRAVLDRVRGTGIRWAAQGTLSMAKDPALLKQMKASGCELILIGFESLEPESLSQMNKSWQGALAERDQLVRRIHDAGLGIYATFVFGYDGDTARTLERTLEFARRHRFYTAAFNHLLPFPGTPLYSRMQAEGRLLYDRWWLAPEYHYGQVAFQPRHLSPEALSQLCRDARKAFAALPTVLGRGLQAMGQTSPALWALFWAMNLRLGTEIDEKMHVPLGRNLDELPK